MMPEYFKVLPDGQVIEVTLLWYLAHGVAILAILALVYLLARERTRERAA